MYSLILILFPLISLFIRFMGDPTNPSSNKEYYERVLGMSILNFIYTLILIHFYDVSTSGFQYKLILNDQLIFGLDGISLWLILLVNLIIPIVILSSWRSQRIMTMNYISLILIINILSNLVFMVLDLLLFYIAFEAILIPMYILIGFFGSRNRKLEAQSLFFLFTLIGSLCLLVSMIVIILETGTTDYEVLLTMEFDEVQQRYLWLGYFIAFAVKMPMVPFHIWLPQAHTEAPTGGSVILAAILLKLGTYGFIRYSLPLFPEASQYFAPLVIMLSLIGIIYSCISALSLIDLKQIIAYSSIAHMNVSMVGLFSNDLNGLSGCFLYSISHGFISAGLFLLVGIIYDRYHTRTLKYYRGLVLIMPLYILSLFLFLLMNISFPGTLAFIAELFIYLSSISLSPFVLVILSLVAILLPIYLIWTFHKISYGSFSIYLSTLYQDLTLKEFHLLLPLFLLTILYGIYPHLILDMIELPLMSLIFTPPSL